MNALGTWQSVARSTLSRPISHLSATDGKVLSKKLLLSMTVTALKAMCSKLFKEDVLNIILDYRGPEDTQDYPLDEEYRQLSFAHYCLLI